MSTNRQTDSKPTVRENGIFRGALKTLGAYGDGGVVTTNDEALAQRILRLRSHGVENRDVCVEWGYNSRLDTIQAALLLVKLKYLEEWTNRRRQNAAYYQRTLADNSNLRLPADANHEFAVYHTFIILAERRDELIRHLADYGVGTAIHYPVPIHLQAPGTRLGFKRGDLPVAELQAEQMLSLPIHHGLKEEDLCYVANSIRDFYGD